jgi:hypothetical protein
MLQLTEIEQELLKKQKNEYLYLLLGFLGLSIFFVFLFYPKYTQSQNLEMKITIIFCGLMWVAAIIYIGKHFWDINADLEYNNKLILEGTIDKISTSIGENGGNTSFFMHKQKYSLPKEAHIEYSDAYDFIQEGNQAILYIAPKSKLLLGIKRINPNNESEFDFNDE